MEEQNIVETSEETQKGLFSGEPQPSRPESRFSVTDSFENRVSTQPIRSSICEDLSIAAGRGDIGSDISGTTEEN
jgi:hypothetical protein